MDEWSLQQLENQIKNSEKFFVYFYTPLCGTCKVAGRMLSVIEEAFPTQIFGKLNLNYVPRLAEDWKIESVPCLIIFQNGKIIKQIYAFHNVSYLYEQILQKTV